MPKNSKFYGKLEPAVLQELDGLLLKLKELNKENLKNRVIKRSEIVPLPEKEYLRFWDLIRHCCLLVTSWPNIKKAIGVIASKSGREPADVQEECVDTMTIHVYTYAWRHYEHSEECEYVFSTATFGWKAWIEEQNNYHKGFECAAEDKEIEDNCGHKVCTLNFA